MKIAHWHSQHLHEDEQLVYSNLLGSCRGNEGEPPEQQHCDTRQGDRDIKWNPANPDHRIDEKVRYLEDGTIETSDQEFQGQIDDILNLNAVFLQRRRRERLQLFLESLGRGGLKKGAILKLLGEWSGEARGGELEPYCQIVVFG